MRAAEEMAKRQKEKKKKWCLCDWMEVVIILQFIKVSNQHVLNLHNIMCQLHLNKGGRDFFQERVRVMEPSDLTGSPDLYNAAFSVPDASPKKCW